MTEFVDTNVLVYAHEASKGRKNLAAAELMKRLARTGSGALSVQVLVEFYSVSLRRLGLSSEEAEAIITDLCAWPVHRPSHVDVLRACELHRRFQISWWDALILNSAIELGCEILWTEDLSHGRRFGPVVVRNPFAEAASA